METTGDTGRERIGYSVKDFIDAAQLKRDMSFSPNDLTTAMMEQASLFTHYGTLYAQAQRQVDAVRLLLENTEAAIYKVTRNNMDAKGEKYTETLLERLVSRNSRVVQMKKALNEARRVESICKIAVEGFRHRRDMLIQQGFLHREEMKGEVRIAERNARADALEMQKNRVLSRLGK